MLVEAGELCQDQINIFFEIGGQSIKLFIFVTFYTLSCWNRVHAYPTQFDELPTIPFKWKLLKLFCALWKTKKLFFTTEDGDV